MNQDRREALMALGVLVGGGVATYLLVKRPTIEEKEEEKVEEIVKEIVKEQTKVYTKRLHSTALTLNTNKQRTVRWKWTPTDVMGVEVPIRIIGWKLMALLPNIGTVTALPAYFEEALEIRFDWVEGAQDQVLDTIHHEWHQSDYSAPTEGYEGHIHRGTQSIVMLPPNFYIEIPERKNIEAQLWAQNITGSAKVYEAYAFIYYQKETGYSHATLGDRDWGATDYDSGELAP